MEERDGGRAVFVRFGYARFVFVGLTERVDIGKQKNRLRKSDKEGTLKMKVLEIIIFDSYDNWGSESRVCYGGIISREMSRGV